MNCHRATADTEKDRGMEERRFFSLSIPLSFSVSAVALWHK
jgi:hypothetical protein